MNMDYSKVFELLNQDDESDAITIPERATNGDMIMTMFPNAVKSNYIESGLDMKDYVTIYFGDYEMRVSYDWWNAPYKKEGKNDSN